MERRNSDPIRPPAQLFEDGTGLLNIASTVLSKPANKRRVKSYSASKLGRSHGTSNPESDRRDVSWLGERKSFKR